MGDPQQIRVLYVDDDPALFRLVQKTLDRKGFDVEHASNAADAIEQLKNKRFDVVAVDHYLGDNTGLQLLQNLASLDTTPPTVYVTGSSEMNVAVAALKAGASDFVPKTVGDDFLALLSSALQQAVAGARLRAQKEAAEENVRIARDRAEVLLSEVNHRIANSLALVSSLVNLQANVVVDPAAKEALAETTARIFAIASVHKRLYSSGNVRFVELDEYLPGLLENLEAGMRGQGHAAALSADIAPLILGTDAAINLGIIVAELVTNAFKYAFPESSGKIWVMLAETGDGRARLIVGDNGIGRQEGTVKGTGLGTKIVGAMATSMGAEISYPETTQGTVASLVFPLQR
jgi:two-component sensor histidine kinase/CheY-like chemotaxis protein